MRYVVYGLLLLLYVLHTDVWYWNDSRNVLGLPQTTQLLRDGATADELIDRLLAGVGAGSRHRTHPVFHCPCSRERALRTLILLGRAEIREIIELGQSQEVCCEFCGERYLLTPDEIGPLLPDA